MLPQVPWPDTFTSHYFVLPADKWSRLKTWQVVALLQSLDQLFTVLQSRLLLYLSQRRFRRPPFLCTFVLDHHWQKGKSTYALYFVLNLSTFYQTLPSFYQSLTLGTDLILFALHFRSQLRSFGTKQIALSNTPKRKKEKVLSSLLRHSFQRAKSALCKSSSLSCLKILFQDSVLHMYHWRELSAQATSFAHYPASSFSFSLSVRQSVGYWERYSEPPSLAVTKSLFK